MTTLDRARLLDEVVGLVRASQTEIMRVYEQPVQARLKDDCSPLTEADLASHRVLTEGLARLMPSFPVVSEEGELPSADVRASWPAYWLVDPLDGTKEFLAGNGEFTVNVALVEHTRPTLGVVGVPARDQIFVGDVIRRVATRFDATGRRDLHVRRYAGTHPTVVASRRHGGDVLEHALERISREQGGCEVLNVGSALKLCLLAEGKADVYPRLGPTSEWDTAAAQAVLEAAGGSVVTLDGSPLACTKRDILNPSFVAVADPSVDWLRYFSPPQ